MAIYAAYYTHNETGEKSRIYYEGADGLKPGATVETWNGDTIKIEFKIQ